MTASRTLHDVDGFKIEVAYVGIGRVIGQTNSLKQVHVTEGLVRLPAFHAVLLNLGFPLVFEIRHSKFEMSSGRRYRLARFDQ